MLVDRARIFVRSGKGGDGCMSFRREKFVPKGGPNGGDGGDGGDVMLIGDDSLTSLLTLTHRPHYRATHGEQGKGSQKHGSNGADCIVKVPLGTLVTDEASGELLADISTQAQEVIVAQGGKGGYGNEHFKSATNQAPRETTLGEPIVEHTLRLELKLIADIGLVGLPNAGKSTLLRAVSRARPKVGEYPFTTLYPHLGIVERESDRFVMADIPGLIKGAATGAGLGISFLRHLRRTRLLLHVVDIGKEKSSDSIDAIRTVERELIAFDKELATRSRWMVLNKADLVAQGEADRVAAELIWALAWTGPCYVISAATGEGCASLTGDIFPGLPRHSRTGLGHERGTRTTMGGQGRERTS